MADTTTNLSLEIIDSSDYVSPDPINNNFEIVDELGTDYVTESGTSGSWWYRKWKSGRAECGIDYKSFGTTSVNSTMFGGLYKLADTCDFGSYPFTFSSTPMVVITPRYWTKSNVSMTFVKYGSSKSTSSAPVFDLLFYTSSSDAPTTLGTLYAGIYVCGKVSS